MNIQGIGLIRVNQLISELGMMFAFRDFKAQILSTSGFAEIANRYIDHSTIDPLITTIRKTVNNPVLAKFSSPLLLDENFILPALVNKTQANFNEPVIPIHEDTFTSHYSIVLLCLSACFSLL